ncbi:unnamed protein product [Arabidopsis arenosa]|uniref:MADS-box domain-containing protein n=1 Tax=Arabidopsis arenosa TaxID=38785 RepID=A0A8S2AV32_ARAAE|nr:unnamed protein product [Arabidopsis arenosa]
MGGPKRKIPIEKIEKKESRAVCFSKRRIGLYCRASELCLHSDAQIAILTTPTSLSTPLEDESLAKSEDLEELRKAIDSMSKMLRDLKELRLDSGNNYQRDHQDDVKNNDIKMTNLVSHETLNLQFSSETFGILDDCLKTETEMVVFDDQFLEISESTDKSTPKLDDQAMDLVQIIDFESLFDGDYESTQEHPETAETSLLMNSEMEDVSMVIEKSKSFSIHT